MRMKTTEAILHILGMREGPSKLQLAKKILRTQVAILNTYLNGTPLPKAKAEIIENYFGIEVTDAR